MSKLMSILIKQTFFCIFILLTLSLFITCNDPSNPFTNNQGEKVVVEPPIIDNISPVSGSFLTGVVTFTATAKAYIKVERVEVFIYGDEETGQVKQDWTDLGIQLSGSVKEKQMTYEFDTTQYNGGNDGPIRMKFRVFDSTGIDRNGKLIEERGIPSIELYYIIKNNPSVIKMAYPSSTDIKEPTFLSKIQHDGDIRGQVIDRRGLRPGYPQIKLWPENEDEPGDEGWASLFLTMYDDMGKEGDYIGPGKYADRYSQRVVNAASFSMHLAEYDIVTEPDPNEPDNPDFTIRKIQYRIGTDGKHIPYEAGRIFNFRIRTMDTSSDPLNKAKPTNEGPFIKGHFPPMNFDTTDENNFEYRGSPVRILIFNSDMRPDVEINNDDILNDPSKGQAALDNKPNIYITEPTSKKIAAASGDLFRLRLLLTFNKDAGSNPFTDTTLKYLHESTGRSGDLVWNGTASNTNYTGENNTYGSSGKVFTFTATSNTKDAKGNPIFTSSSEPYILIFTVNIAGMEQNPPEYRYVVYMDGTPPTVSIRSVRGAYANPKNSATEKYGGLINKDPYIVNGNIQIVVDRTDDSGIMAFNQRADMGEVPYADMTKPLNSTNIDEGRPMVKWILEPIPDDDQEMAEPSASGSVLAALRTYSSTPNYDNLKFFRDIKDERKETLTAFPSGWVMRPLSSDSKISEDKTNNFKIDTTEWNGADFWLYVIAMDQVQNLGFTVQKIRVDQSTDIPEVRIPALFEANAGGTDITGETDLDVTVWYEDSSAVRKMMGNWSEKTPKRNILTGDQSLEMNFLDDDGINAESGITIRLTDLNVIPAGANPKPAVTLNADQIKDVIKSGNKKDWAGSLSQAMMAEALGQDGKSLRDGMYKIEITVTDNKDDKVDMRPQYPGADPQPISSKPIVYYFAVYTEEPDIQVTYPDDNAWGGEEKIIIQGTARSRLNVKNAWITFSPNVARAPGTAANWPYPVTLVPVAGKQPDSDDKNYGYYEYTWEYAGTDNKGVSFHPIDENTGEVVFNTEDYPVRRFTVEAYDRLGNMGNVVRTVQIDGTPPAVTVSDFNNGRLHETKTSNLGVYDVSYVYGKVAFTVSASDANGMYEAGGKSGIKWWVVPLTEPDSAAALKQDDPKWGDVTYPPYPKAGDQPSISGMTGTWQGGGHFSLDQATGGGLYTWVIDTRYLKQGQAYKLCIVALDKAGNPSENPIKNLFSLKVPDEKTTTKAYEIFIVDQSLDYPAIDANSLDPQENQVKGKLPVISGTVSDADLFNPANRDKYVAIRFPTGFNGNTPVWSNNWIEIKINSPYSSAAGGIDPSGAIVYKFNPAGTSAEAYLNTDGVKYYQIRVTDEPVGPTDDEKKNGAKWYGKNPNAQGAPVNHGPVSIIFPQPKPVDISNPIPEANPAGYYSFVVDDTFPEIFFDIWDPTPPPSPVPVPNPRPGYSAARPTFSSAALLIEALSSTVNNNVVNGGNYVKEYKLDNLSMSYSGKVNGVDTTFRKVIINNRKDPPSFAEAPADGKYPWSLNDYNAVSNPDGLTSDEKALLTKIFNAAPEGMQIITFEATDLVPFTRRVSYSFAKDTKGPEITFTNIARSIKREPDTKAGETATVYFPGIPVTGDFPDGTVTTGAKKGEKWASDWPANRHTNSTNDATWKISWDSAWTKFLTYWPSEYAFKDAAAVNTALTTEHNREPSTVIGDDNTDPVIRGTFSDENSSVRKLVPAGAKTYFYYRFRDKNGSLAVANGEWIEKEVEAVPSGQTVNEKTADWEIILKDDTVNKFTGKDGENWVDIKVEDTAGNVSEIFNVRFLVDRAAPVLGSPGDPKYPKDPDAFKVMTIEGKTEPSGKIPGALPVEERVFSGAWFDSAESDTGEAFTLSGTVSDCNLSGLTISIGQEGYDAYSVVASLIIDPTKAKGSDTGVVTPLIDDVVTTTLGGSYNDPVAQHRLTVTGPTPISPTDDTPQWTWTLKVLKKDVAGLRKAAGNAADSTRRYIRVQASDKANKKVGPVDWFFYLDTKKPTLDYSNLEKGGRTDSTCSSFETEGFRLSGLVSDDTKIKDVQFMIGRWSYKDNGWRWYNGSGWTLTVPPPGPAAADTDPKTWPSLFSDTVDASGKVTAYNPTRQTSMSWTINQATLDAVNQKKPNTFPDKLFTQEGVYRLDLYITDFSLGSGNPHYTYDKDDTFGDAGYEPGTNSRSGRVFYYDKQDPILKWTDTERTYYKNETNGQVKFGFIVSDGNTIQYLKAEVTETGKGTLLNGSSSPDWTIVVDNANKPGVDNRPIPIPTTVVPAISTTPTFSTDDIESQSLIIAPFMTTDGTNTGDPLDKDKPSPPTYTITISVKDGANRTASISKQFTLDNTPPRFIQEKFSPATYKFGNSNTVSTDDTVTTNEYTPKDSVRSYSYDAVAGRLNIRGNTEDNSNQLKRVAFYVLRNGSANFKQPKDITQDATGSSGTAAEGWHWFDPERDPSDQSKYRYPDKPKIQIGSTTIEIEDGTFNSWRIIVPKTSLLKDPSNDYVQWTTTGTGTYDDAVINYTTGAVTQTTGRAVPALTYPDLPQKTIPDNEEVGLLTVYLLVEDVAGNIAYDVVKYWVWPEGDRPIVTINSPDASKTEAERLLNGTIRLSGMAKDNERVKYVWFRVLPKDTNGTIGAPYTLQIPRWDESTWEAVKTGNLYQVAQDGYPKNLGDLGSKKGTETDMPPASSATGGWYMANGGGSKDVSWWAYINTNGELDPQGNASKKEFVVEVRAQDVTWDDSTDNWMDYTSSYKGLVSQPKNTNAWVVAGAPIFENAKLAPSDSVKADTDTLWDTLDNLNIRNRSAYKVTVKHSSGLSAVRWSPTFWDRSLNTGAGAFQANPTLETLNLLELDTSTTPAEPEYYYVYRSGAEPTSGTSNLGASYKTIKATRTTSATWWTDMNNTDSKTIATPRMAVTVKPPEIKTGPVSGLTGGRSYLIFNWDTNWTSSDYGDFLTNIFTPDESYYETVNGVKTLKNLKNTVLKPSDIKNDSGNIGKTVLIESEYDDASDIEYFKWDIIVDVRADLLLTDMTEDDTAYGNNSTARAGQTRNSVRYPVYLSASEVSKATPLTSRGDALLPIDNLPPSGQYTLNRKPAGNAATIGGTAEDPGPVNGLARVVLWFQRKGTTPTNGKYISWHEKGTGVGGLPAVSGEMQEDGSNDPVWWANIKKKANNADPDDKGVIPSDVKKPPIGDTAKTAAQNENSGTGANWAIVIDTNSPSVGKERWGHKLPTGFADGGRYWYVEINSLGIESGPVDLHFVVMDKAGNAKYYKERLVIMNGVAVIDRVKLGTDIRHNTSLFPGNRSEAGYTGSLSAAYPVLDKIRAGVPLGTTDVQKGISDWVLSSAMGAGNIVDFNVRNNVFALRVETTDKPSAGKKRSFRLEYVSGAKPLANTAAAPGTLAASMRAGRVYMIDDPGTVKWGALGADGDSWNTGDVFIATINGQEFDETNTLVDKISGIGSVWELNSDYYTNPNPPAVPVKTVPTALALSDYIYTMEADPNAKAAEFVYGNSAFGTAPADRGSKIVDHANDNDAWPPKIGVNPVSEAGNSMFILRVFDGDEDDYFGDFTILRVRVNNNDRTKPFAQIYDINPKTEGQERQNIAQNNNEERRSVSPMFVGEGTDSNRTKGGLWNIAPALGVVEKPGHIEPRKITYSPEPYKRQQHSLSSLQMGGAVNENAATIQKPWANPDGFFNSDTVSGRVVLRGYAEDDQRVHQVVINIGGTTAFNQTTGIWVTTGGTDITILDFQAHSGTDTTPGYGFAGNNNSSKPAYNGTNGNQDVYGPPLTGLLQIPANTNTTGKVYFTDSIDAYRHRVEWAYVWDTETINGGSMAGNNVTVSVRSYNSAVTGNTNNGNARNTRSDHIPAADGKPHSSVSDATRPNTSPYNRDFPTGLYKYNSITMNLRPYITGFMRNKSQFAHDTRSRQGRYMFARNEAAVVTGFNLGASGGTVSLPGAAGIPTSNVANTGDYGITETDADKRNRHYRQFTVNASAVTGNGLVMYTFNSQGAVNTGGGRTITTTNATGTAVATAKPDYIQPWNIEYSPGKDGTELWDDFTQVHIWRSDNTTGGEGGRFASTNNWVILSPAMSINPADGTLWESHNESGSGYMYNTGTTRRTAITTTTATTGTSTSNNDVVTQFVDPIFFSDVYRSPGGGGLSAETWTVSSIIGRSSDLQWWRSLGGVYIHGVQGSNIMFAGGGDGTISQERDTFNRNLYHGESTWYNASSNNTNRTANPPSTDQFMNPHIVTSITGTGTAAREHIHVSYYDDKDNSIKYRYNRRGPSGTNYTGTIDPGGNANATNSNAIPKMWTNLDGGLDLEDTDATKYTHTDIGSTNDNSIAANTRVVRYRNSVDTTKSDRGNIKAGKHNSIAVTSEGYPVIAYYDETNQRLKMAVSRNVTPILASNWVIRDFVIPENNSNSYGTGEFVSMKIDTRATPNVVHIAAMNTNKRLVYVTGDLYPDRGQVSTSAPYGGQQNDKTPAGDNVLVNVKVQVVDSVGNVGRWCALSLDANGNPWISYMDESYIGARDGAKVAFLDKTAFYKGVSYFKDTYIDINGEPIGGWETLHVPTLYRVENPVEGPGREHGRLGMECFPTRNTTPTTNNRIWNAAVGYLSRDAEGSGAAMDRYRVAYYVK